MTAPALTKTGIVTVERSSIAIYGFDAHNANPRDCMALAMIWAIKQLRLELECILRRPGHSDTAALAEEVLK